MEIRRLEEADAPALWRLRLEALESEPAAFAESAEEHRAVTLEEYARRLTGGDSFVLGAFDGSALVGMAGFYREARRKRRHRGWIWGVFVRPEYRGRGIARALMTGVLDRTRRLPELRSILLTASVFQTAARRLYLELGFRSIGIEPRALRTGDQLIDEEYMILLLD